MSYKKKSAQNTILVQKNRAQAEVEQQEAWVPVYSEIKETCFVEFSFPVTYFPHIFKRRRREKAEVKVTNQMLETKHRRRESR